MPILFPMLSSTGKLVLVALCLIAAGLVFFACGKDYIKISAVPVTPSPSVSEESAKSSESAAPKTSHALELGRAAFEKQNFPGAVAHFKEAVSESPESWGPRYWLGRAFVGAEEYVLARQMFQLSLERAGTGGMNRSRIYCAIARAWELEGELGEARLNYLTANNLNPDSAEASEALLRLSPTGSR